MCRASRRNVPPKKPPRLRQRTASEMPPRVVGLLKRKAWSGGSSATPLSEEDEPVRRQLPGVGERAGPVANGYRGGVSSEAESGAENKGREFSSESRVYKYRVHTYNYTVIYKNSRHTCLYTIFRGLIKRWYSSTTVHGRSSFKVDSQRLLLL